MSDTDSFIDEVSEEVRRDRLFKLMKKYGWIAITLVILLVGGASYIEWNKARDRASAEALGDKILAAFQAEEPAERFATLKEINSDGATGAMLGLLTAGEAVQSDDPGGAIESLRAVAADASLPATYRDLAELKLILIEGDTIPASERISRLEPLAVAGGPYRLLAEEQMAVAEISTGNTEAALQRLQNILADGEVTAGLRRRVSQLIVALGGDLTPA